MSTPESINALLSTLRSESAVMRPLRKMLKGLEKFASAAELEALYQEIVETAVSTMRAYYVDHFSTEEVEQLTAFHSSPLGQKSIAAAPWLSDAVEAAAAPIMERFIEGLG